MYLMDDFIAQCSLSVPCKLGATTIVTLVVGGIALLLLPLADGHLRLRNDQRPARKDEASPSRRSGWMLNRKFLITATLLVWIIFVQKIWGLLQTFT